MAQISVEINGRSYRMACDDGEEEHLLSLGQRFDAYIGRLRELFGEIGDQRLTVMAGITVIDEMTDLERRVSELEAEIATLRETEAGANDRDSASQAVIAQTIEAAAGRIEACAQKLAQAGEKS